MSENKSFVEDGNDLIPASMLAAFAYCPRLCYLQFVQGEFLDSAELADGRFQHRWIDAEQDLSMTEKSWPHSLPKRYFTGRANLFFEGQER